MVSGLADSKALCVRDLGVTDNHSINTGQRRALLQPGLQNLQRAGGTVRQYLDRPVRAINCVTLHAEALCLSPCTVTKPHALHTTVYCKQPGNV